MSQELRSAKLVLAVGVAEMNMVLQHIHPFARTVFQLGNLNIMYRSMTGACVHFVVNFYYAIPFQGIFFCCRKGKLIKP